MAEPARRPLKSRDTALAGRVARLTNLRGRLLVHVEVAPGAVIRAELTRDACAELGIAEGTTVYCVVKTSAFRWLS